MQIPCVYLPGPAPAVSVANNCVYIDYILQVVSMEDTIMIVLHIYINAVSLVKQTDLLSVVIITWHTMYTYVSHLDEPENRQINEAKTTCLSTSKITGFRPWCSRRAAQSGQNYLGTREVCNAYLTTFCEDDKSSRTRGEDRGGEKSHLISI